MASKKNNNSSLRLTDTLVVNLYGGPGAGKSTMAAGVFYELKTRGINCELAAEYAKDLVYEERHQTFQDQIYIFGKQYHRMSRLMGRVQVIVSDSPLPLTIIYDAYKRDTLKNLVLAEHNKMWSYNAVIKRGKKFSQAGRRHDAEASKEIDIQIVNMLDDNKIPFETFDGTPEGRDAIVKKILTLLAWKE